MNTEEIKNFFRGDVEDDDKALDAASLDASIFKVRPKVVVHPKDTNALKTLIKFIRLKREAGEEVSLTARSAGTDMSGGPLTDSIVVSFTRYFNHIKDLGGDYAVVEPGVYYRDLEKLMNEKNLMVPSYPASKGLCTVGGMVSNNSGGEKTLAYGKTEQYVKSLKVVLSNGNEYTFKPMRKDELEQKMAESTFEGELYKKLYKLLEDNYDEIKAAKPAVTKNSAGYYLWNVWDRNVFDLTKLIVGSQGTLGFVSEITFKLIPKKRESRLAVVFLPDLKQLGAIVNEVLKFKPESFESYDDHTLKIAVKFLFDLFKVALRHGNPLRLFWLGIQFIPDMLMVIRGGAPKLILLAEITSDNDFELGGRIRDLKAALTKFNVPVRITKSSAEAEKYWTIRRESFNLLRHRIKDRQTAPFIDDIVVKAERLPEFLPKLEAILEPYGDKLIYTVAGHVGDGNFHIIPLMDLHSPSARTLIPEISAKVYRLVSEFKGSITGEHNDGLIRTPYLKVMYNDKILRLFKEVKDIFDPLGMFNPRKKVGGDFEYTFSHIK